MVGYVGPDFAVQILLQNPDFCQSLPPDFYEVWPFFLGFLRFIPNSSLTLTEQGFILEAIKDYKKKELVHSMLETLDGYLWLRKPNSLNPNLKFIQEAEFHDSFLVCIYSSSLKLELCSFKTQTQKPLKTHTQKEEEEPIIPKLPFIQHAQASGTHKFNFDYTGGEEAPEFLEELEGNWGVVAKVEGGFCPLCTLPLVHSESSSLSNIIFLDCGHAFHHSCLPQEVCVVCAERRRRTLLKSEDLFPF